MVAAEGAIGVADEFADEFADAPVRVAAATARRNWLKRSCAAILSGAAVLQWTCLPAQAQQVADGGSLPSLVVLEFELVDDQGNPLTQAAQETRLRNAGLQLQRELSERRLYRVMDPAPTAQLQRELREQQEYLYRCDDCAAQVGRRAEADLVMQTWVQKVSELILNLNVQIYDVAAAKVVFTKSVDMRGNDDVSWMRAVRFLVRDMAEKRERNPKYGL